MPCSLYSYAKTIFFPLTTYPLLCLVLFLCATGIWRCVFGGSTTRVATQERDWTSNRPCSWCFSPKPCTIPYQPGGNQRNSVPSIRAHQQRVCLGMAAGRVLTRNPRVLDLTGAGSGADLAPRVRGFGDLKRGGSGAGFSCHPRVPVGDLNMFVPSEKSPPSVGPFNFM
jgi:hypothetical protein